MPSFFKLTKNYNKSKYKLFEYFIISFLIKNINILFNIDFIYKMGIGL